MIYLSSALAFIALLLWDAGRRMFAIRSLQIERERVSAEALSGRLDELNAKLDALKERNDAQVKHLGLELRDTLRKFEQQFDSKAAGTIAALRDPRNKMRIKRGMMG